MTKLRKVTAILTTVGLISASTAAGVAAETTKTTLVISGMVTGFAPDPASGVLYPSDFSGPVESIEGSTRSPAGWYSEKTQYPVVAPGANPLGFVGTVGIAEFTFQQNGQTVGTITTLSYARLVEENGADGKTDFARGVLCARADGFVIGGTGIYRNTAGSFQTRSIVNLGLLTLETKLELKLWVRDPEIDSRIATAPSCCRPAIYEVPRGCEQPARTACEHAESCGWISRSCRLIKSPLRSVFR